MFRKEKDTQTPFLRCSVKSKLKEIFILSTYSSKRNSILHLEGDFVEGTTYTGYILPFESKSDAERNDLGVNL